MRILLVEDEQKLVIISKSLSSWLYYGLGYRWLTGKHQALSEEYDLIIFRRDVTWTKWLEYYQ